MGHPLTAPYGTETAAYATCFYYRGLVPQVYTTAAEPSTVMLSVYDNEDQGYTIDGGITYLDGSGGKYSTDPRRRRVGWGWAYFAREDVADDYRYRLGQFGTLNKPQWSQTVPQAEIRALVAFLRHLVAHHGQRSKYHVKRTPR